MCSLTGSTIICCRSLFKLAVWCCPLPQPPRIIHCWCLNLPFQCWLSFNSYPRLCVSICYIVKLSIDILWFSFHGRAINQYNSIFTVPQSQGDPKILKTGTQFWAKRGPKGDLVDMKRGPKIQSFQYHSERLTCKHHQKTKFRQNLKKNIVTFSSNNLTYNWLAYTFNILPVNTIKYQRKTIECYWMPCIYFNDGHFFTVMGW